MFNLTRAPIDQKRAFGVRPDALADAMTMLKAEIPA